MADYTDNRDACSALLPSSCIPYTGSLNNSIKNNLNCRPNINDVLQKVQDLIDNINSKLGDNTKLDKKSFDIDPLTVTQEELNQLFINTLDTVNSTINILNGSINPDLINLAVDLLCLTDASCEPKVSYTLTEIINKLLSNYCSLLTRVQTIETTLNI